MYAFIFKENTRLHSVPNSNNITFYVYTSAVKQPNYNSSGYIDSFK